MKIKGAANFSTETQSTPMAEGRDWGSFDPSSLPFSFLSSRPLPSPFLNFFEREISNNFRSTRISTLFFIRIEC